MSPRGRSSTCPCEIDGCGRPHMAKGVCCMHYRRFAKTGSYEISQPTAEDRLWARVVKGGPDECWPWQGPTHTGGYGRLIGPDGKTKVYAHRLSYELASGTIPEGLVIDHTCHNNSGCAGNETCQHRRCVNPAHLEAVTDAVNSLRGVAPAIAAFHQGTCTKGHPLPPPAWPGQQRFCRVCEKARRDRRTNNREDAA